MLTFIWLLLHSKLCWYNPHRIWYDKMGGEQGKEDRGEELGERGEEVGEGDRREEVRERESGRIWGRGTGKTGEAVF